jgi:hypothetical protein
VFESERIDHCDEVVMVVGDGAGVRFGAIRVAVAEEVEGNDSPGCENRRELVVAV